MRISKEVREKIHDLVEKESLKNGLELVDVEYQGEDSNQIIRIYIDSENGIDLDDCEKISRNVEDPIDELVSDKYILEVSSPGLNKPLKTKRDFERNLGEKVTVKLRNRINKKNKLNGKIIKIFEENLILKRDNSEEIEIPFSNIKKGKIIIEI